MLAISGLICGSERWRQTNQPGSGHGHPADKGDDCGEQYLQVEPWAGLLHVEQVVLDPLMEIT